MFWAIHNRRNGGGVVYNDDLGPICVMKLIQWPRSYPTNHVVYESSPVLHNEINPIGRKLSNKVYNMIFTSMHNEINPTAESYPTKSDNMIFTSMHNEINPMAESYLTKSDNMSFNNMHNEN